MTKQEMQEYMVKYEKAINTPEEDVNLLYSAGKLNDIILGAIRMTLEEMDYPEEEIRKVTTTCERVTFDLYMATQLREKA